jgi:hypothetical protein
MGEPPKSKDLPCKSVAVSGISSGPSRHFSEARFFDVTAGQWLPWAVVALLIVICATHGFAVVHGLAQPGDLDSLRDVGSIQGLLDGNWFGDPVYAQEWRWYPPLLPALGAIGAAATGASPLAFWVQSGPWLNLLTPLAFFLMARSLFGPPAGAAATGIYVCLNSALGPPWMTGGYTPWPLVPSISQAFFFAAVALIRERVRSAMRPSDAALVGAVIGLTGLAHTVPAVILTAILTIAAFTILGVRARTFGLLALVAAFELAFMAPYLVPVIAHYPGGIINDAPGAYIDPLFRRHDLSVQVLLYAPGLACLIIAWLLRRQVFPDRATLVIVAAWIGVSGILLFRQLACAKLGSGVAACRLLSVPAHHYYFYLQTAWVCLAGQILWQVVRRWIEISGRVSEPRAAAALGMCAAVIGVGATALFHNAYDEIARGDALQDGKIIDRAAYGWIRSNTQPIDLFVTPLAEAWGDPAAFSVIAAGRRLIAAPEWHSNPFVDWRERDALRWHYLAAATGMVPDHDLCGLAREHAWLLVPNATHVSTAKAKLAYRTEYSSLYHITDADCE